MSQYYAAESLAERAILTLAQREGKSVMEIRASIQEAILQGLQHPDPAIQTKWKMIPHHGTIPTPEEVITWALSRFPKC